MDKIKRNERLGAMTKILTDTPNRIHTLGEFCALFGAAKSTISEDIDLIGQSFERFDLGRVETVAGAAGGVRFRAVPSEAKVRRVLNDLSQRLSEPGRMLPGGFLYTSDITAEGSLAQQMGEVLEKDLADALVNGIKQHGLLVQHQIGVVGNAVRKGIDVLKQRQSPVAAAHPIHVLGDTLYAIHALASS